MQTSAPSFDERCTTEQERLRAAYLAGVTQPDPALFNDPRFMTYYIARWPADASEL